MRSYEAARTLFSILAFIAWSAVISGVLVALAGAGGGSRYGGAGAGLLGMVPGIIISILGLIQVAFVQMGRANVDTAEYTQQMLKISRDQLEVSKQALNAGKQQARSFADITSEKKSAVGFESNDFGSSDKPNASNSTSVISATGAPMYEGETLEYSGHSITFNKGKYRAGGMAFETLNLAEAYIDRTYKDQVMRLK